jgi:hypothetical protein
MPLIIMNHFCLHLGCYRLSQLLEELTKYIKLKRPKLRGSLTVSFPGLCMVGNPTTPGLEVDLFN